MFQGKKILLAITGSIAAYKAILLVRLFVKEGADVKVVMTPAAKDFVSPLTLSTLSRNSVISELFSEAAWSNHVMLGRWSDVMLIAPLSANTLAKMATGACDNMLLATYLSATCPVVAAPAMDEDMWRHPATQANIKTVSDHGVKIIPVNNGELASGLTGEGRMAEPEDITRYLSDLFFSVNDLKGKKALVTAGPTYEPIDPVRFIGNHSTGKMGIAIARELASRGAEVSLVLGPSSLNADHAGIQVVHVHSAEDMYTACISRFDNADIAVMSAAVADYTPATIAAQKIKKTADPIQISLVKTKDILKSLGERKKNGQVLVGFALETENERQNAVLKLTGKNADMIVLNSLNDNGAGFGGDTNKITIFETGGTETAFPLKSKQQAAKDIVDRIVNRLHDQ